MSDLTPDDLARLLLPAAPALLEGWCGPVAVHYGDGPDLELWGDSPSLVGAPRLTLDGGETCVSRRAALRETLSLDLARAECRDRVARVLYGHVKGWPGRPSFITFQEPTFWLEGIRWWPHQWDDGTMFYASGGVPALADLDPNDPRRLPDGSRYVDALALRLVAEEVLRD